MGVSAPAVKDKGKPGQTRRRRCGTQQKRGEDVQFGEVDGFQLATMFLSVVATRIPPLHEPCLVKDMPSLDE